MSLTKPEAYAAGRAFAASGSAPKILLGRQAERAENSGARATLLGERLVGEAMSLDMRGMTERERAKRITTALSDMRRRVGIPDSLGARGVHVTDIPELTEHALSDACLVTNPRRANSADIKSIYGDAL